MSRKSALLFTHALQKNDAVLQEKRPRIGHFLWRYSFLSSKLVCFTIILSFIGTHFFEFLDGKTPSLINYLFKFVFFKTSDTLIPVNSLTLIPVTLFSLLLHSYLFQSIINIHFHTFYLFFSAHIPNLVVSLKIYSTSFFSAIIRLLE